MTVPDAAIDAAAEALYTDQMLDMDDDYQWPWTKIGTESQDYYRERAAYALTAAMPAIREALAQEIEVMKPSYLLNNDGQWLWVGGRDDAARIVRGGNP